MSKQVKMVIKELRGKLGITQKELAKLLNVSFQTISKWENGINLPDIIYLPKMAEIFDVSTDVLLGLKPLTDEEQWRKFDDSSYWSNNRKRTRLWKELYWNEDYFSFLVREVWNINHPVDILDYGCGYGFLGMKLLPLLPEGSTYTGIDMDGDLIKEAYEFFDKTSYRTSFINEDVYKYKPEKKYDIVISLYLMSYLQNPDLILQKMKASLTDNGIIILIDVNMEVEQAGYYSGLEREEGGMERPDFTPVWKSEKSHKERDYRMGTKLAYMLKEIGMKEIKMRISDKVIIYDSEDEENRELKDIFRYVYEHNDSYTKGHSYFTSRGISYSEAEKYVEYYNKTEQYFNSDNSMAVKTAGLYFAWGKMKGKEKNEGAK